MTVHCNEGNFFFNKTLLFSDRRWEALQMHPVFLCLNWPKLLTQTLAHTHSGEALLLPVLLLQQVNIMCIWGCKCVHVYVDSCLFTQHQNWGVVTECVFGVWSVHSPFLTLVHSIQKKSLDLHLRRHHTGESFPCHLCKYTTPDRQLLVRHIRKYHSSENSPLLSQKTASIRPLPSQNATKPTDWIYSGMPKCHTDHTQTLGIFVCFFDRFIML